MRRIPVTVLAALAVFIVLSVAGCEGLLRANATPGRDEVRLGMSGNICRCGAYAHIVQAVEKAAELRKGGGR